MKIYRKNDDTEFFPTPKEVVDDLYAMLPDNVVYVLDPCCGGGALDCYDDKYDYTLYDLVDRSNGEFNVNIGDFLKQPYCPGPNGKKFDAVIMNPPFGLCEEFIKKSFEFSDDIYVICPFKSVIKNHRYNVVDCKINWHYAKLFNVRVSIGIVHLRKQLKFGNMRDAWVKFNKDRLPKENTWASCFKQVNKAPNKWFIVDRLTMTRVERGSQLIQDIDVYKPGDEHAFIALTSNVNVKKGSYIPRRVMTFNSFEDAKAFQKKYDDNSDYVRNYIYKFASQLLKLSQIPLI